MRRRDVKPPTEPRRERLESRERPKRRRSIWVEIGWFAAGMIGMIVLLLLLTPLFLRFVPVPPALIHNLPDAAQTAVIAMMPGTPTPTPTFTPSATLTPVPTVTPLPTETPTNTPIPTDTLPPSPTLSPTPQQVASVPDARVCEGCNGLRVRETPGTAGKILTMIDGLTQVEIVARTEDGTWLNVIVPGGQSGWVAADYVETTADLSKLVAVALEIKDAPTAQPVAAAPSGGDAGSSGAAAPAAPSGGVISGVSATARTLYLKGQELGNHPDRFSKVGDSITASPFFLYPFGLGGTEMHAYDYLGGALGQFFSYVPDLGDSFTRTSYAAANGWSTFSVLSPSSACGGVKTALECELDTFKPAVALIMLGTNDVGGVASEDYRANMQRIVDICKEKGVIPVLSTIPPRNSDFWGDDRVGEFNNIITGIARANDVPLWDYWSAMINLPNYGLVTDGVHPNIPPEGKPGTVKFTPENLQYGYTVRNLTALEALSAVMTVFY